MGFFVENAQKVRCYVNRMCVREWDLHPGDRRNQMTQEELIRIVEKRLVKHTHL